MGKPKSRKATTSKRTRLIVVPQASVWALQKAGSGQASGTFRTKGEAVAAARKLIKARNGGEIVVHGRDGRIRRVDAYTLGEDSFDKISAVEGISLTDEMKRDFRALDRKGLSAQKRREWLIAKYGK
jgi:hypothetical protein